MKKIKDITATYSDSIRAGKNRNAVPILAPGIGTRIDSIAKMIGTRASAASAGGISDDMLYRYIREESPPSFSAMAGLAIASGADLNWLATGEGPMQRGTADAVEPLENKSEMTVAGYLNQMIMEEAIEVAERVLLASGRDLAPHKKARYLAASINWFRTTTPAERAEKVPERLKALIGVLSTEI